MTAIADTVHVEFARLLELQPYTVVIDDLVITVDEDVFPPDLGRCARNLAKVCAEYRPATRPRHGMRLGVSGARSQTAGSSGRVGARRA